MSVFINDCAEDGTPRKRKSRKKYYTKYNVKYQEDYPWALPSSKGELHAYCRLCRVDICIKSVGAKGLRDHEATCRHSQKVHQLGRQTTHPILTTPTSSANHHRFNQSQGLTSNDSSSSKTTSTTAISAAPFVSDSNNHVFSAPQTYSLANSIAMRGEPTHIQTPNHSLLSSQEMTTLTSSMYPVLEVTDPYLGDRPVCASSMSPQTPNTPSSPFNQEHFSSVNVKSTGVDCQISTMNSQMSNGILPSGNSYDVTKLTCEGSVSTPQFQDSSNSMQRESKEIKEYILSLRDLSLRKSDEGYELPPTEIPIDNDNKPIKIIVENSFNEIRTNDSNALENSIIQENNSASKNSDDEVADNNNASSHWTLDDGPNTKSSALSVGDLTCNICGEVFLDWKELKKDLLEHVKEAQKGTRTPVRKTQADSKSKKKTIRVVGIEKQSSTESNQSVVANKNQERRRRGRPPRGRKKVSNHERPMNSGVSDEMSCLPSDSSIHNSFMTPSPKRKRGRPSKSKPLPKEDLSSCFSMDCASADEEYWVETFDLVTQQTEVIQRSNLMNALAAEHPVPVIEQSSASNTEQTTSRRSGQLQCRVCKRMFYMKQDLRDHYKIEHNNGRPYECSICHKFFSTRNHLQVHNKFRHDAVPNPCLCAVCGKTLSSRTNLKIHMMIHKGVRPFSCPICAQQFSRKANMEQHMVYHTGERKFICEVCGKSFYAINALKRHKKLHTGERNYECDICGASYVTGTDLRRHRLKHKAVKPFPCKTCDKQFTRAHDLTVHMRYHNKEFRFTCNICSKQFVESGNYRRHMRRHTGERPYACKFCQQTFTQVHHYKVHVRTCHGEQDAGDSGGNSSEVKPSTQRNIHINRGAQVKKGTKILPGNVTHNPSPSQHNGTQVPTSIGLMDNSNIPNTLHSIHNIHNYALQSQPVNACAVSQISLGSIPPAHINHTTISPPIAHINNAGVSMMAPHSAQVPTHVGAGHPNAGFLQYNSYIYNSGVIPQYPTLFDGGMCPQLPSGSHIGPP